MAYTSKNANFTCSNIFKLEINPGGFGKKVTGIFVGM